MADVIDFENQFDKQFNKFFKGSAASQFNEDNELEAILEATPTGELILDIFNFLDVVKEFAEELELRGFEVVAIPGEDDLLSELTLGVRQLT